MTAVSPPILLVRESPQPFIIKILNWYRENRQAVYDLIGLSVLSVLAFFFINVEDLTETFYQFSREHENWELDEVVLTLGTIIPLFLMIFALRRWAEAIRLLHQANTDNLTGLFNRRKGWELLEFEIARARRYQRPLTAILIDIDHFKEINDTYGHLAGDRALKMAARTLRRNVRGIDVLIRWGGEEFAVISPETSRDEACLVAERLRQELELVSTQNAIPLTASFGVAQLQKDDDLNTLFKRADDRLYEAKSAGRNTVM